MRHCLYYNDCAAGDTLHLFQLQILHALSDNKEGLGVTYDSHDY